MSRKCAQGLMAIFQPLRSADVSMWCTLEQWVRPRRTTSVIIMPGMPQSKIGDLLAAVDLLLVHLKDEPVFQITIPSKTQFYLAMGKPILMGMRGDAADLVKTAGAGVVV